jgi:hypothetical protein
MNKLQSTIGSTVIIIASFAIFSTPAYAEQNYTSNESINNAVSSIVSKEFNNRAQHDPSIAEIGPVTVELTQTFIQENGTDPSQLADIFLHNLDNITTNNTMDEKFNSPLILRGTQTYSACVSIFLMQIDIKWICQDFRASVLNGAVTNKLMLGTSYDKGIGIGAWSHNRNWFEQPTSKELDANYKGNVSAVIKGGSISYPLTVMAIFDVNASNLKQHFQ